MGNQLTSSIRTLFAPTEPLRLLLLGLDAAGKTTILYKIKSGSERVVTTIPRIGFFVETLNIQGTVLTAWDTGGRDPIWATLKIHNYYMKETDGIIFVIDSTRRLEDSLKKLNV